MASRNARRICIDRVIRADRKLHAAELAVRENPRNAPGDRRKPLGVSAHPFKIAIQTGKRWQNGKVLTVRFLDGSALQRQKVQHYAKAWSRYANLGFDFVASGPAVIRVSFVADADSWSAIGTDCLSVADFPKDAATVNFGWLRDGTDDVEYRRVVEHEFGHVLGAIHEHQNPAGGIQWNLPAVYKYFEGPPNNWTKADIDYNVIQKYSVDQLNGTQYDSKSIMLYSFPPELILNHVPAPENTQISKMDKTFIAGFYPKPKSKAKSKKKK